MRSFFVFIAVLGAAACGFVAVREGSVPAGLASLGFLVVVTIMISSHRRRHRKAVAAASAASSGGVVAPTPPAPVAPVSPMVVAPVATVASPEPPVVGPVTMAAARSQDGDVLTPDTEGDVDVEAMAEPHDESTADPEPPAGGPDAPHAREVGAEPSAVPLDERAPESLWAPPTPYVRTPFSVQPAVVLMSFYDAIAERFDTLAAHLWLEDHPTDTLRLVAAFGPRVPSSDPVPVSDPILGAAARTRTAVFARLNPDVPVTDHDAAWRYAVPVGTPEVRGVAAVDILCGQDPPSAVVLNEVSSVLRGSLTAALAVHVARSEMDAAVLLLQTAQDLASGMAGQDVLASALERAMQMSGASTGSIMVPECEGGVLRIVVSKGLSPDIVQTTAVSGGEGIAGTVYTTSAPMLVEDLPGRAGQRRHGVLSAVSVPISDAKGSFGVLNVGARAFPARLTDAYVRALGILGTQTAVAMRNAQTAERSWDLYLNNLESLAAALEADDPYRKNASKRITRLAVALGEAMGLDEDDVLSLRIAAILHDLGMGLATGSVGAVDRPLSTVDRGLVRSHAKVASDVLLQVPALEEIAPLVRHHHERFDGDGYDTGLAGAAIPLGSRILAVVDSFVAMTSPRAYRDALTAQAALEELDNSSGGQFDPEVVEAFVALAAERPELTTTD